MVAESGFHNFFRSVVLLGVVLLHARVCTGVQEREQLHPLVNNQKSVQEHKLVTNQEGSRKRSWLVTSRCSWIPFWL